MGDNDSLYNHNSAQGCVSLRTGYSDERCGPYVPLFPLFCSLLKLCYILAFNYLLANIYCINAILNEYYNECLCFSAQMPKRSPLASTILAIANKAE